MRSYDELISSDPAWPEIADLVARAGDRVTVLPRTGAAARACLEGLQVSTRSALGAIAHETGGLLVDHAWVRVLGAGHAPLARTLGGWNHQLGIPLSAFLIVADDVLGGTFAVNGGALGPARGNVFYFAPDSLDWTDLACGHGQWLTWLLTGDLAPFYASSRWPDWPADVATCGPDRALSLYPFPWTAEGRDLAAVSRKPVPAAELWRLHMDAQRQR